MPLILPHYFTPERIADFWSKVDRSGEHWLWIGALTPDGYGYTRGFVDSASGGVHRVAWFLATSEEPTPNQVLHTCDVKNCVRNDEIGAYSVYGLEYPRRGHLFLGDNSVNFRDRSQKYWARKGINDVKLVAEIRDLYHTGMWFKFQLAERFNVPVRMINDVINNRL
jgi:hypothetical protein